MIERIGLATRGRCWNSMHLAFQFLITWSLAFVSLAAAITFLNIYDSVIGNDLELLSFRKEAGLVALASLVEGTGFWLVASFMPNAGRALVVPALIVALIYKIAHLEDWRKGDILMLLTFQLAIGSFAVSLFNGHFQFALLIFVIFAAILVAFAGITKML